MNTRQMTREIRLGHWRKLINERNASGKTIAEFCEEQEISPKMYYYWQRQLREAAYQEISCQNQLGRVSENTPVFAKIEFKRPEYDATVLIVRIGGIECEIRNGAGKDTIENTLSALQKLC